MHEQESPLNLSDCMKPIGQVQDRKVTLTLSVESSAFLHGLYMSDANSISSPEE